jgi:hypothetical protein
VVNFPFVRRRSLIREPENAMARRDEDRYKTRSRCPACGEFATEGGLHTCPATEKTVRHENPAAPKPKPEDQK